MKRILVVEDDPISAMMVTDYLQSRGYDVAVAMDGDAAIERCIALQPDLMILDVLLPKRNGFSVCFEIARQGEQRPPILLMSAVHRGPEAKSFALDDLKVEGFLEKPFKLKALLEKVESLL